MEKVEIIISEGHIYICKDKLNQPFTSVDYNGGNYGGASPCDNSEEIKSAIEHAKETIIQKGDKPIIIDKREKMLEYVREMIEKIDELYFRQDKNLNVPAKFREDFEETMNGMRMKYNFLGIKEPESMDVKILQAVLKKLQEL